MGRPNSLRPGFYFSNFQTADKAAVEVFKAPADGDLVHAAVRAAVVPGGSEQADDKLSLPSDRVIKVRVCALVYPLLH